MGVNWFLLGFAAGIFFVYGLRVFFTWVQRRRTRKLERLHRGSAIVAGLRDFCDRIERGETIDGVVVSREMTPDGPLHNVEPVTFFTEDTDDEQDDT